MLSFCFLFIFGFAVFWIFLDEVSFNSRKARINTFLSESLKSQVFLCISYVTLRVTDFVHCLLSITGKISCLSPYFKISLALKSAHRKLSSKKLKRMYCNINVLLKCLFHVKQFSLSSIGSFDIFYIFAVLSMIVVLML